MLSSYNVTIVGEIHKKHTSIKSQKEVSVAFVSDGVGLTVEWVYVFHDLTGVC